MQCSVTAASAGTGNMAKLQCPSHVFTMVTEVGTPSDNLHDLDSIFLRLDHPCPSATTQTLLIVQQEHCEIFVFSSKQ